MSLHLLEDEQIIWESFIGKKYRSYIFFRDFLFSILISVIFFEFLKNISSNTHNGLLIKISLIIVIIGFFVSLMNQINYLRFHYYLTNERLVIKYGILSKTMTAVNLEHVLNTKVVQKISELLIKTGTIYLFTANEHYQSKDSDPLNQVLMLKNIDDPFSVHEKLEQAIENNRDRKNF